MSLGEALELAEYSPKVPVIDTRICRALQFQFCHRIITLLLLFCSSICKGIHILSAVQIFWWFISLEYKIFVWAWSHLFCNQNILACAIKRRSNVAFWHRNFLFARKYSAYHYAIHCRIPPLLELFHLPKTFLIPLTVASSGLVLERRFQHKHNKKIKRYNE